MTQPRMEDKENCYKLYDQTGIIHRYSEAIPVKWVKVKKNNDKVGWILASLLETHVEKIQNRKSKSKSKRKKRKSKRKTKKSKRKNIRSKSKRK